MDFRCCSKKSERIREIERAYSFLRSLSDPNRLKAVCVLRKRSMCVCEIVSALDISDKLASHHLKKLKEVGLLAERREGNFIRYSLDKKKLREYKGIFNKII